MEYSLERTANEYEFAATQDSGVPSEAGSIHWDTVKLLPAES